MPVVSGIELSDADLAGFREVFDLVDKDKSGAIEMEEVEELTQLLGMDLTRDEVELLVREIDKDGNGEVDFEEFLLVMAGGEKKGRCGKKDMLRSVSHVRATVAPARAHLAHRAHRRAGQVLQRGRRGDPGTGQTAGGSAQG
jgi:hypothetical protein